MTTCRCLSLPSGSTSSGDRTACATWDMMSYDNASFVIVSTPESSRRLTSSVP
jgi:hypothetical protein